MTEKALIHGRLLVKTLFIRILTMISIFLILVNFITPSYSYQEIIAASACEETSNESNQLGISALDGNISDSINQITVQILASSLESRIDDAAAVLEITSKLPQIMSTPNSSLLNANIETLHGIPNDADMQKRKVALDIISDYDEFSEVAFVMPNGDRYFLEPYSSQINGTTNNFAYRDYFKGAITTNGTYLGDIITSAASGLKRAVTAVPVHSQTPTSNVQGQLVGIWVGAIDIDVLNNELQSLNLTQNQRIVYVDSNGTKIADSDRKLALNGSESFYNLTSLQNAIDGESGSIMEEVGGEMMQISYAPVLAVQKMWAVLLLQSLDSINNSNDNNSINTLYCS